MLNDYAHQDISNADVREALVERLIQYVRL